MNCEICGKNLKEQDKFSWQDDLGRWHTEPVCNKDSCINAISEKYSYCEPSYDVEEIWQKQQDDLWEADVLWKED